MITHAKTLELIANDYLSQLGQKPNFENRDFMNTIIIFQTALMDKLFDNMVFDDMPLEERLKMAEHCGNELHKFIFTYTNIDTKDLNNFI